MLTTIRRWRHGPLKRFDRIWIKLGQIYRLIVKKIGLSIPVTMLIGSYGPFKLHSHFAFSNFENWSQGHNNGFEACVSASKTKKCVVDIGAHVGLVTLPMSDVMARDATVIAFEPANINFKYLTKHITLNKKNNVMLYDCLVGDKNINNVKFYERNDPTGMNSLVVKKNHEKYITTYKKQITLDSFFENSTLKPELIKIDVEGAEVKVLQGARNTLKKFKPVIFLSVHPVEISLLNNSLEELIYIIHDMNYQIFNIDGTSVKEFGLKEYLLKPT